jgi:hypothetical protein
MVSLTRRRALRGGAVGLLPVLSGCSGLLSTEETFESNEPDGMENVERDPEHFYLRNPEDELPAWIPEEGTDADEGERDRRHIPNRGVVADRETADRIRYADVDGVEEAEAFVAGTDFESETLLLEITGVNECYEPKLCFLTWSQDHYRTYYTRQYRPAEFACGADDEDGGVQFIRVPDTLDPDRVTGSGSSFHTRGCWAEERQLRARQNANGTTTSGGGES